MGKSRQPNRFAENGVTERGLRGRTKTKLERVKRLLEQLSGEWDEISSYYSAEIEALYSQINDLQGRHLEEVIADLKTPVEDDWR